MEIQQLKGFLAVAKHKSFSKAAEITLRTQPAISLQIKSLEEELDVILFDRLAARKVILTEEGKLLYDLASPLIDDIDNLSTRFSDARGKIQRGSVRIATHTSVIIHLLPDVIKQFKKSFPKCELSIVNRDRKGILSMLADGEADIGITSLAKVPQTIEYTVFKRFERILITPIGHPLSTKKVITLKDIAEYPLILPPKGSNTREIIDSEFKEKGIQYRVAMEVTGKLAIKTYVEMNLGIAIINGFYITEDDKIRLHCKNMEEYFGIAERGILTSKNKYLSNHAKEFIKLIHSKYPA